MFWYILIIVLCLILSVVLYAGIAYLDGKKGKALESNVSKLYMRFYMIGYQKYNLNKIKSSFNDILDQVVQELDNEKK